MRNHFYLFFKSKENPKMNKYFHRFFFRMLVTTFTFSRRFYPKRLTNEDNRSNQNQQKSNDTQVL